MASNNVGEVPQQQCQSQVNKETNSSNQDIKYVCTNCLNSALQYDKEQKSQIKEAPQISMHSLELSKQNENLVRSKIDYAIRSRINRTDKIKGAFNQQSKSEIYNQAENSKNKSGYYWCGDAYDPKKQRVLRNYEQISKLNVDKPSGKSSKGQNDYYEKCVNNVESTLNQQEYKEKDPETQRTLKSKYNEDLSKQIESKKNLQNKMYSSWKEKERIEAEKMEARYQKQREENNQRRIRRNRCLSYMP